MVTLQVVKQRYHTGWFRIKNVTYEWQDYGLYENRRTNIYLCNLFNIYPGYNILTTENMKANPG
jgi:hypothetical protein